MGRWHRTESSRDHDAWEYREGERVIVELERDRPSRYHANGVSGSVTDMEAPVDWSCTVWDADDDHELFILTRGLKLPEAKREALSKLTSPEALRKATDRISEEICGGAA